MNNIFLNIYSGLITLFNSDFFVSTLGLIVFDIPRYFVSTITVAFFSGRTQPAASIPAYRVSVIIPMFNGAGSLARCVAALKRQTLPPFEIIVVNDGSIDNTRALAREMLAEGQIDHLIHHGTRCGKAAAVNHGARFATGDLILVLDDDNQMYATGLAALARAFDDPQVEAAGGNLLVGNKKQSFLATMQAIEYLLSISMGRSFLDMIGSVACVSGAYGMFRRNMFMALGGLNAGSGEDLEMTLRIRKIGFRVRFVADAFALVDGLNHFGGLYAQRARWDRDSMTIRLRVFKELSFLHPFESLSDTLQRLDYLLFDFFPTLIFPFYVLYVISVMGTGAAYFFLGLFVVLISLSLVNISIVLLLYSHKLDFADLAAACVFPLYQGLLMKAVRFVAYSREILFSSSHQDEYVPPRVRTALYSPKKAPTQ